MTETIKANDPKNREEFLELIAKKADRPRHELANDPLVLSMIYQRRRYQVLIKMNY